MSEAQTSSTHFGDYMRQRMSELGTASSKSTSSHSAPIQREEWRRLARATEPFGEESLRGLVARACWHNTVPNSWGILGHLGQQHRNRVLVAEDPNIDPAELAYALRAPEDLISAKRYEPVTKSQRRFFGLTLYSRSIETRVRRFSPRTFKRQSQPFHHALWEIRDIPFCLEGWDMLQEQCGCEGNGVVQGWTRTLTAVHECDRCGDPLSDLEPIPVPEKMIEPLSVLRALVDPNAQRRSESALFLPSELRNADRSRVFDVITRLSRAIDPHVLDHPIETPARRLGALSQACAALRNWPHGFDDLVLHESCPAGTSEALRKAWCALQPVAQRAASSPLRARIKRSEIDAIGVYPATKIAGLNAETLLAAWENGLVTRHYRIHAGKCFPAFVADEVAQFARAWRARMSPESVARELGISLHGVEQLVALGILRADAPTLPNAGLSFTREALSDFHDRLASPPAPRADCTLQIRDAVLRIGGRPKPWGPIFAALLTGEVAYAWGSGKRAVHRLLVSPNDVDGLCALTFHRGDYPDAQFDAFITQRDAFEMLNIKTMNGYLGLEGLPLYGKKYAVADVEARVAEVITLPEIAAQLGCTVQTAYTRLRDIPRHPRIPGVWERRVLAEIGLVCGRAVLSDNSAQLSSLNENSLPCPL